MQDYNTIIGAIQMRLNKCSTRSVMDRFRIGSSILNLIMNGNSRLQIGCSSILLFHNGHIIQLIHT